MLHKQSVEEKTNQSLLVICQIVCYMGNSTQYHIAVFDNTAKRPATIELHLKTNHSVRRRPISG